jgi:hypothetical protein
VISDRLHGVRHARKLAQLGVRLHDLRGNRRASMIAASSNPHRVTVQAKNDQT